MVKKGCGFLIEWLAFPLAVASVALIPKGGMSDKKKIDSIFKNTRYGIPGKSEDEPIKTPTFKFKKKLFDGDKEIGMNYHFSVPLGLPATKMKKVEKEINVFSDGLGKPVEVDFKKGYLQIKVYNEELPELFLYSDLPQITNKWVVPIGKAVDGLIWHNFDHTPHMTGAGTTRFGKTVLLRMMMTYLIENHPNDVEFYIIDLKGGLEFSRYSSLEQVKGVASNVYEAAELLEKIKAKFETDYEVFRKNNYSNVVDTPIKNRRFIIVDEAAQLAPDRFHSQKEKMLLSLCQGILSEVARVAGALGYRLIFATQYPTADTLPRQIKQNADAKITFRLPSGYASGVAIDDFGAEELPSDIKGRALFKTHELKELQVPFISHDEMWKRLEKHQQPQVLEVKPNHVVEYREEEKETGENLVKFGKDGVRN